MNSMFFVKGPSKRRTPRETVLDLLWNFGLKKDRDDSGCGSKVDQSGSSVSTECSRLNCEHVDSDKSEFEER